MRVSKEKAAENRERILTEAARLFLEHGLTGVGVDAVAEAAGLTHGSVYSQFGSKERLAAEALGHAAASSAARLGGIETLDDYLAQYLSEDHRGRRGLGCLLAALGGEIPRQTPPVRHSFTEAVKTMIGRITRLLPVRADRDDKALAVMAGMVGALILARGIDDPDLADRILTANRSWLGKA